MARIRVISKYDPPDVVGTGWRNELASQGILKSENAESLTLNEVTGKITSERNEGKSLTIFKALQLGAKLGVQSLAELHAQVPGSYAAHLKSIDAELAKSLPKGVDGTASSYTRVAAALGAFPDEVLLKITSPGQQGMDTKYYLVPTSLSKEGAVVLGPRQKLISKPSLRRPFQSRTQNRQSKKLLTRKLNTRNCLPGIRLFLKL